MVTPAPDFEVERLSSAGKRTGELFRLSSFRGAPVALAFGSYASRRARNKMLNKAILFVPT